jgi:hypothetical protein
VHQQWAVVPCATPSGHSLLVLSVVHVQAGKAFGADRDSMQDMLGSDLWTCLPVQI